MANGLRACVLAAALLPLWIVAPGSGAETTPAKGKTMDDKQVQKNDDAKAGSELPLRPVMKGVLRLNLRTRVQPFKASDEWQEVVVQRELPVAETALLLCDVWDKHWCQGANERLAAMLPRMAEVVRFARDHGVQIIHAPSDTMATYAGSPFRQRAQAAPLVQPPKPLALPDPPLPVDASDQGCTEDPPCRVYSPWKSEHPAIETKGFDAVTDKGQEVYNLLQQLGIRNLIIMGVHTNMCVLHRSFAIKQMTRWGVRCVLVRDLTDTMYSPKRPPHVPHERGTELVVEYIEKHWCPTVLSADLLSVRAE